MVLDKNRYKSIKNYIVEWIRDYFSQNGPGCSAVVGISGGKDSTIVASLCCEALGKDNVVGVWMPNGVADSESDEYKYAVEVANYLGIKLYDINIGDSIDGIRRQLENLTPDFEFGDQARMNLPPRIRMSTLYAVAQSLKNGGRVANTCNYSEDFVGYSTKYGDSAGDFSPISNLLYEQVLEIGEQLNLPEKFIKKPPSDGLCGKTDEDNFGFTYKELDEYILTGRCGNEDSEIKIKEMHRRNSHKRRSMPKPFSSGTLDIIV